MSYAQITSNQQQNFSSHPAGRSNVRHGHNQNQVYLTNPNTHSRDYPNDLAYNNQRTNQEYRQSHQQHQQGSHQHHQQGSHQHPPQQHNQQHGQQIHHQQGPMQSGISSGQPTRSNIQSGGHQQQHISHEHSSNTSQSINRTTNSQQSTLPSQPTSKQNLGAQSQLPNISSSHQQTSSNAQSTQEIPTPTQTQIQAQAQAQPSQPQHQTQHTSTSQQNTNQQTHQQPHTQNQSSPHSTSSKRPISSSDTLVMYYGTKYEVKCEETFAYYEGYVVDYDINEHRFHVMYDWKPMQRVPANYVRPLAPPTEKWWKPKVGEQIECQAKAEESEPFGWWGCTVQGTKNNLYKVVYDGWDSHNDVMSLELLRPKNKYPNLTETGLTRHALKLSPERANWVTSNAEQLSRIATKIGLVHLGYRPDLHQLIFVGLKRQIDDGKLLLEHIWEIQNLYSNKEQKWAEEERKIQSEYDKLTKCISLKFIFDTHLTGFIIGKDGKHILAAKEIPGVEHINVKDLQNGQSECLILATDREAAEEAREHLEMERAIERIPRSVLPDLIGPGGENISKLEQSATVSLISTLAHYKKKIEQDTSYEYDANDDEVDMVIVGPKINIAVARSALQSEVKTITQRKQLVQRSQSARTQLKKFQKDDVSAQYDYKQDYNNQDDGNNQRSIRRQQKDQSKRQYHGQRKEHSGYNEQSYSQAFSGNGNQTRQHNQQQHQHHHNSNNNNGQNTHEQKTNNDQNDNQDNNDHAFADYDDVDYGDNDNGDAYDEYDDNGNIYEEYDEHLNYDGGYNDADDNVDQDLEASSGRHNYQTGQQKGGYQGNYRYQRGGNHQRSPATKKIYVKKQSGDTNA